MGAAEVTVTGSFTREPTGKFGPEVVRATVAFDRGELVMVARDPELVGQISAIGQGSTVEVRGRLEQHHWRTGNAKRQELQLVPESVVVVHDARKERMLGA